MTFRKHTHAIYRDFCLAEKLKISPEKKNNDIFDIFAQNIDYGYALEPPRRCGSNKYPQSIFWTKIRKQ